MKSTYEKISSENKLTDPEHHKQIQKDINRTFPENKFFCENSEG